MIDLSGNPFFLSEAEVKKVHSLLSSLSDEKKIGQLFLILGDLFDEEALTSAVKDKGIGGVLFRPDGFNKVKDELAHLDSLSLIPLLKAANLECGGVGAYKEGTYFTSEEGVAATMKLSHVKDMAAISAEEARKVGVNWSFSPVVDLDKNYLNPIMNVRTFGSSLPLVKSFSSSYVKTLQRYGVAASAKHFPGDGVDYRDQHLHPTINSYSYDKWMKSYGSVYKKLIGDGLLSVMVGHIEAPYLEKEIDQNLSFKDCMPASLSKNMLEGVLRGRLGFNGLICSDATIMGGYTMKMERKHALAHSINSGIDMLVFNTDFDEDYGYMLESLNNGELSLNRLDEAVARILALKLRLARPSKEWKVLHKREKIMSVASDSVTLVKDLRKYLPLSSSKTPSIRLIVIGDDELETGESITSFAENYLSAHGFEVEVYHREKNEMHGTKGLSPKRATLYLVNLPPKSNQTTVRIEWNPKHALDGPRFINEEESVFVSLSNPYHLQDVPLMPCYINSYAATAPILAATLSKILGESPFLGKSPVDPFCGLIDTHF